MAMDGVEPINIITDQDAGMAAAIREVFPNATHRNCRWHIVQNATEKMGPFMGQHPEVCDAFNACVNNSLTPEEFESNWMTMIDEHQLRDNVDLYAIWEQRKLWVPAYFMHSFFPFLQTTARSEGFNAVLKKYVKPTNSLFEFLHQYMAVQEKILNAELRKETETALTTPAWWCENAMEKQMAKAYTRTIFLKFQEEMKKSMQYQCEHTVGYQFVVSPIAGPVIHYGYRDYNVFANWDGNVYRCNCCKFERDGILCCHVIKVMTQLRVHLIPPAYILKRWSFDAEDVLGESDGKGDPGKQEMPEQTKELMIFQNYRDEFAKAAKTGVRTNDGRKIISQHLKVMKQELNVIAKREEKKAREADEAAITMPSSSAPNTDLATASNAPPPKKKRGGTTSRAIVPTASASGTNMSSSSTQHIQNPDVAKTKGRPQQIANKNPLDLAPKNSKKTCSYCHEKGHTMRKCKERLKMLGYKP